MRDLNNPYQRRATRDVLQSLLAAEAFFPSDPLWILSGWISDIPIIDNSAGDFLDVDAQWPLAMVSLSSVLRTIVRKGGSLNFILRDAEHNHSFIERMRSLQAEFPIQIRIISEPDFHEKSILGRDFELSGSMNFTYRGLEANDENLILRTDRATISERRITLERRWQEKFRDTT